MKAIRQYEFGEADTLRYEDVPDPEPSEGQVRIRVAAAGVHLVDTTIRRGGQIGPNPPPTLPMTPAAMSPAPSTRLPARARTGPTPSSRQAVPLFW